ncbi:hypothetical protein P6115_000759 [Salmonella enterica]|uniref:hypothetical protein n=1 Tax=Salmonella enterica TaxID=28901 RepID=UPI000FAA43A3|nr:hypothetical protein [Salmonella enterica subsp. enterica serovar Abony]EAA4436194.1 hypothetical protein [Salmonella enterica subsp. salamae]EAM5459415.1 hypothetical protein [Salmonella enterica]EBG3171426.1 hypothetical protein [Salmonella enterica subsp. enterica serovar Thetford]ECE8468604.1 hypothetical protein [Salmonella enterica subsp. enterica serovar London]ECM3700891.1 hypothetical protein [Salmonella enterica subsp. enterica serovar Enteritidis]ECY3520650.1 hypothetical protei
MRMEPKDFKFDETIAAHYANPKAELIFKPRADGFYFKWEWEGKTHELYIEREKLIFPDLVLQRLFEAAIDMAQK